MIITVLQLQIPGVSAATENVAIQAANNSSISQPITLSLKDACEKAVDNTYGLKKMDKSIEKLWKQESQLMTMSISVQEQLDRMSRYTSLYERRAKGETLTIDEKKEIFNYSYMFGDKPPLFSGEEMYEQYIKNRDIPHYSTWVQIQNLKRSRDITRLTLEDSIRSLYATVIYLRDFQNVTTQSLKTMEKEYENIMLQYDKGLISEIDRYQCQISLDKRRLELKKQNRNKENTELLLKNKCGIPASQEIELEASGLTSETQLLAYKVYRDRALKNRNEIVTAKLELTVVTRELDIMKQYLTNPLLYDRMELQQKVDNALFSVTQVTDAVLEDIQWAFADVVAKRSQVSIAKKASENAEAGLTLAEKKYKLGLINILAVWNAKDAAYTAEINYSKAQRDFEYAHYKINLASGLGPKYRQN